MNSKKQILLIGTIFLIIFSILFFSIRAKYYKSYNITTTEINGINEITNIHKIDIQLKISRGLNQLDTKDAQSLKNNLFINEEDIADSIKKLHNQKITNFYNNLIIQKDKLSKMEIYKKYTELLKLLNYKRIDTADSSYLLLEQNRDIHFLVTVTVLKIPNIIENIGKVRALGVGLLNNYNNNNSFLLHLNLKSFIDSVEEIRYTINKINPNDRNRLNSSLDLIVSDFYTLKIIVSNIEKGKSTLNSKEYFLKVSKLVNKIDKLFSASKEILTLKLVNRKSKLRFKLLLGSILYAFLMLFLLFGTYYGYRKFNKEIKLSTLKKEQHDFMQKLQKDYTKDDDLKKILDKSLNHLIHYFNAINGTLYIYNDENKKLYLGSAYGINYNSIKHTLDLHENSISENILEKSIKITDIDERITIGSIQTSVTKLMIIPILEFGKSIGTIQLVFDDSFSKIDIDFLLSVVSFMGTYINKAQKDEESDRYLRLIDKNVLISKTDLDGNIIEVSEQLCSLSQYTKEELIGQTHRIFRHPDMKAELFIGMWNSILKGDTWNGEIKDRKKDGSYYWVNTHIAPDCDVNGNTIGYTAIRTDVTDKKRIEEIAITDGLTSLYNRRHFDTIFPQQIAINKRAKSLLGFMIIDIDHFKQYNDTYGHQDGDNALKLVASTLKETLNRPNDYTFRLGGEEFGFLFYIKNTEDAILIAEQARENIEKLQIIHATNSASKYVTISSGLYVIKYANNLSANDIYKKTDEALYKAKQNGRNQVYMESRI